MSNIKLRVYGFRGGRVDSSACGIKPKRYMKVEYIDREELLEIRNTTDLTGVDYEPPDKRAYKLTLTDKEKQMVAKTFADGLRFF